MEHCNIKKYSGIIGESFLFSCASQLEKERIFGREDCIFETYLPGESILEAGSLERSLFLIFCGKASVGNEKDDGVLLRIIGKGDVFGAANLFGAGGFPTCVKAITEVRAARISREAIEEYFSKNTIAAMAYIGFLTDRVRFLNSKINIFTRKSALGKLAAYLSGYPGNDGVTISLTALSNTLDIGRASLYRALDLLEKNNIIEKKGRKIIVRDPVALGRVDG